MTDRITIRLPPDLVSRAKRKAAAEGRTLTAVIEDGLRRVLAEDRTSGKPAKPLRLPVSKASGGLVPGIDLQRSADLQEQDDLAYAKRLKKSFK